MRTLHLRAVPYGGMAQPLTKIDGNASSENIPLGYVYQLMVRQRSREKQRTDVGYQL